MSCPLANSNYATIRADPSTGALHLYIKVVERAHLPAQLWERHRLSSTYTKALAQLDELLAYWPGYLVHKCKQRLTRLTQVTIKTKALAAEQERLGESLVPRLAPKVRKREAARERKAEAAAKVERAIERELIERLRSGAYGDRPLNVEEGIWKRVLKGLERKGEGVRDEDLDEGIEEEENEEEEELEGGVEYVSDIDGESEDEDLEELGGWFDGESADGEDGEEDDEEDDDDNDEADEPADGPDAKQPDAKRKRPPPPARPQKKRPRVEIEYEEETLAPQREALLAR